MNNPTNSTASVLALTEQKNIKFIDLQFTDVVGVVKNVTIPAHELVAALENGIWFEKEKFKLRAGIIFEAHISGVAYHPPQD